MAVPADGYIRRVTDWDLPLDLPARPLGDVARVSGRLLNDIGDAQMTGADNLVGKAMRALEIGDEARAARFIERACGLGYNERELLHYGPWAAHMLLHSEVSGGLEDSMTSEEEWLDVALEVREELTGVAREHLSDILYSIAAQADHYGAEPRESRRITKAVGTRSLESDFGLAPDASVEKQAAVARALVEAALRYHRALYH